jgi:hypothetical protein
MSYRFMDGTPVPKIAAPIKPDAPIGVRVKMIPNITPVCADCGSIMRMDALSLRNLKDADCTYAYCATAPCGQHGLRVRLPFECITIAAEAPQA